MDITAKARELADDLGIHPINWGERTFNEEGVALIESALRAAQEAALREAACDCGAKLTTCASCAVADYQAAHTDCATCCPAHLSEGGGDATPPSR